jgi:serine protease AprX
MKFHFFTAVLLFTVIPWANSQSWQKIDPSLNQIAQNHPQQEVEFLIILQSQEYNYHTDHIVGKVNKAAHVKYQLKNHKAPNAYTVNYLIQNNIPHQQYFLVDVIYTKCAALHMQKIAQIHEVKAIIENSVSQINYVEERNSSPALREGIPEWGIKKIKADSVWLLGVKGKNVVIGGQDTGYDFDVSPLLKKYRGYDTGGNHKHDYNWFDAIATKSPLSKDSLNPCGYKSATPCDDNNHGTHTMGTMVGSDNDNSIGVAPEASWIGCRNMERGNGQLSTYLACFDWFFAPTDRQGKNPDITKAPHVINNSWFCSVEEGCNKDNWSVMQEAVKKLKAAGIAVVVSAGNSGPKCNTVVGPPAIFKESFSVGSTTIADTMSTFSSRGLVIMGRDTVMKPNVTAPGSAVRSVINNGAFASFSGTSMAGPHVAATIALMISANPKLSGQVKDIESILISTADPIVSKQVCNGISTATIPNPVFGYGRINAYKAVKAALNYKTTAVVEPESPLLFTFMPNPTSEVLFLNFREDADNHKLKIFDHTGKLVFNSFQSTSYVDVSNLPSGIFIIEVSNSKISERQKFIKL